MKLVITALILSLTLCGLCAAQTYTETVLYSFRPHDRKMGNLPSAVLCSIPKGTSTEQLNTEVTSKASAT